MDYYNVEESLKQNLQRIVKLITDIIEEEVKLMAERTSSASPITYYNPNQGEIQAEIAVPVDVVSLKQYPDVSPLLAKVNKVSKQVAADLPDHST